MTREPDCENASGVAGWGANYCSFVVQMRLKEWRTRRGVAFVPFCHFAPLPIARLKHGCQMAIARFLDRICLALWASGLWLYYAALQSKLCYLATLAAAPADDGGVDDSWQCNIHSRIPGILRALLADSASVRRFNLYRIWLLW